MTAALAAVLLVLPVPRACAAKDPFAAQLAALARRGGALVEVLRDAPGGIPVAAAIHRPAKGKADRLFAYALRDGQARLVYAEPNAAGGTLAFDETLGKRRLPDFCGDGSRALIYRSSPGASARGVLTVVRIEKGRFRVIGRFRGGRLDDLDRDGAHEVVHETLPLGSFFPVSCGDRGTMAREAARTEVSSWKGARFAVVSHLFPDFFRERLRRDEEALAALESSRLELPGRYLEAALVLFFDYDAMGERRAGWNRLTDLLEPPPGSPPGSRACVRELKAALKPRLSIPEDWP